MRGDWRDTVLPSLALFGSTSTLLCCALPAVLISLGGRGHGRSDLGYTRAHVAVSAKERIVYRGGCPLGCQLYSRLASKIRSLPDRPREGGQLSAAAPFQCLATHHVIASLRLRSVLRLCLGARVLLTIGKTTRCCK